VGYGTISAGDGETALLRLSEKASRVQMVVLDLGMPGMGGWECLKKLRTINPKLPVLVSTGYGSEELPERARQEGAAGLINKPYQLDSLLRTVRKVLDMSQPQGDS
jgi:DNA-binding NtrC family response regulator